MWITITAHVALVLLTDSFYEIFIGSSFGKSHKMFIHLLFILKYSVNFKLVFDFTSKWSCLYLSADTLMPSVTQLLLKPLVVFNLLGLTKTLHENVSKLIVVWVYTYGWVWVPQLWWQNCPKIFLIIITKMPSNSQIWFSWTSTGCKNSGIDNNWASWSKLSALTTVFPTWLVIYFMFKNVFSIQELALRVILVGTKKQY